jgi:hypothetical protein
MSFQHKFSDGSIDHTSPHRKGFRFADTDDADRLAADEAYQERSKRMATAWQRKGQQHDAGGAVTPPPTRTLDALRKDAETAYEERNKRMRNAWRQR